MCKFVSQRNFLKTHSPVSLACDLFVDLIFISSLTTYPMSPHSPITRAEEHFKEFTAEKQRTEKHLPPLAALVAGSFTPSWDLDRKFPWTVGAAMLKASKNNYSKVY